MARQRVSKSRIGTLMREMLIDITGGMSGCQSCDFIPALDRLSPEKVAYKKQEIIESVLSRRTESQKSQVTPELVDEMLTHAIAHGRLNGSDDDRLPLSSRVCLTPKSPLIGNADSTWFGMMLDTQEVFSSVLLSEDDSSSSVSHKPGSSETMMLWMDDPLSKYPFQPLQVVDAMLRMRYRSTGIADCCLVNISSPTVFSGLQIFSAAIDDWVMSEVELDIEATSYYDWADLGLRIKPGKLESNCSPVQINLIEICINWRRT